MRRLQTTPVLSLVLCSRNDRYMGNSRWRLETALNYVAGRVEALGREQDVEVLVADWGSEVPLREVLVLGPTATRIVSFGPCRRRWPGTSSATARFQRCWRSMRRHGARAAITSDESIRIPSSENGFCGGSSKRRSAGGRCTRRTWRWKRPCSLRIIGPFPTGSPSFAAAPGDRAVGQVARSTASDQYRACVLPNRRRHLASASSPVVGMRRLQRTHDLHERHGDRHGDTPHVEYTMIDPGKLTDYDFYHLEHYHPRGLRSRRAP